MKCPVKQKKLKVGKPSFTTRTRPIQSVIVNAKERKFSTSFLQDRKIKIKPVDYTQMIMVRIDAKTTIYAKPGENVEEVKNRFLINHRNGL